MAIPGQEITMGNPMFMGRAIGVLLLAQAAAGFPISFVLLEPVFGHPVALLMLMPLALSYLALAGWLMAVGLAEDSLPPDEGSSR
jgi:hypothetical protein